ncbi:hypothetical protein [Streptomyces alkaliphilus]|nr:hypothetical protein [Streptomyces alkaliphilus]
MGVIEERLKESGRVVDRQAYVRPVGGGIEWSTPLDRIRVVGNG